MPEASPHTAGRTLERGPHRRFALAVLLAVLAGRGGGPHRATLARTATKATSPAAPIPAAATHAFRLGPRTRVSCFEDWLIMSPVSFLASQEKGDRQLFRNRIPPTVTTGGTEKLPVLLCRKL